MNARVSFDWADPLLIDAQLSDEEQLIRDAARGFAEAELMPMVRDAFRDEQVDAGLMRKLGSAGLLGPTIQGYGCAGASTSGTDWSRARLSGSIPLIARRCRCSPAW